MTWDTTLSIEGVATAAGVLGAAVGYVVNLIRSWHNEGKAQRRRGTYSAILHFLEDDLLRGLTEDQLWEKYNSPETADILTRYKAMPPEKVDRVYFEALIRDLRLDRLIELVGRDQYRLEIRNVNDYELKNESRVLAAKAAKRLVGTTAIADRAKAMLLDNTLSRWERKQALELLMRVSPQQAVEQAATLLTSSLPDEAIIAGEVLADLPLDAGTLTAGNKPLESKGGSGPLH